MHRSFASLRMTSLTYPTNFWDTTLEHGHQLVSIRYLVAIINVTGPGKRTRLTSRKPAARIQLSYSGSL